jgi:hypothetical protein
MGTFPNQLAVPFELVPPEREDIQMAKLTDDLAELPEWIRRRCRPGKSRDENRCESPLSPEEVRRIASRLP